MSPKMKIFFKNEQQFWLFSGLRFFFFSLMLNYHTVNVEHARHSSTNPRTIAKDKSRGIWQLLELQGGCRRAFPHRRWVDWLSSNRLGDLRMRFRVRSFFTYFSHFSQTFCAPPFLEIFPYIFRLQPIHTNLSKSRRCQRTPAYSSSSFEITQIFA